MSHPLPRQRSWTPTGALVVLWISASACGTAFVGEGEMVEAVELEATSSLIQNGSFERRTTGWIGWQGQLKRVALGGAPLGASVLKVSHLTGTAYGADDSPDSVASAAAGTYVASAWVKAASASAVGKPILLVIRERTAQGAFVQSFPAPSKLGEAFQRLSVSATPTAGNVLDVYLAQETAGAGDAFYVDGVTLVTSTGSAPPTASEPSTATSPSTGATYYLSPGGSDSADGRSSGSPWRTFRYALPSLAPGDTLVLLDGVYTGATTGYALVNCSAGARNGEAGRVITIRAANERKAHLKADGSFGPLYVSRCSHWTFEGLRLENGDFPGTSGDPANNGATVHHSSDIRLRRLLVSRPNRYANSHGIVVGWSTRVLVEESEVYQFARHGIACWESSEVTYRRNYVNSRGHTDLPDGRPSGYANQGDEGMSFYQCRDGLAENNIAESVADAFTIHAQVEGTLDKGWSDRNRFVGNVALDTNIGFLLETRCGGQSPCVTPDRIAKDNVYENNVVIRTASGFAIKGGQGTRLVRNSVFGALYFGLYADRGPGNDGMETASLYVSNMLVSGGSVGYRVIGHADWRIASSDAFQNGTAFSPLDGHVVSPRFLDPGLGSCFVYVPASSPLKAAGEGSTDIGANVIQRLQAGQETSLRLWGADGSFPCGASATGLNDGPATSCGGVHQRLNVGFNGCPVP